MQGLIFLLSCVRLQQCDSMNDFGEIIIECAVCVCYLHSHKSPHLSPQWSTSVAIWIFEIE